MRVIYDNGAGGVSVFIPAPSSKLSIEQMAGRVVPKGQDYWVISKDDVPSDRTEREYWALDTDALGEPTGVSTGTSPRTVITAGDLRLEIPETVAEGV